MDCETDFKSGIRRKVYNLIPTGGIMSSESCLTLCLLPLHVTLQVLVWPQLSFLLCSPPTTMCLCAGLFTICSTRSERPSPGRPATTPGMPSETVPVGFSATITASCSLPASSSLSETSSLQFQVQNAGFMTLNYLSFLS